MGSALIKPCLQNNLPYRYLPCCFIFSPTEVHTLTACSQRGAEPQVQLQVCDLIYDDDDFTKQLGGNLMYEWMDSLAGLGMLCAGILSWER